MNWRPMGVNRQAQTYEMETDPRYQVRAEWVHCEDHVNRIQYRAFYNGCVLGGIKPSSERTDVATALGIFIEEEMINADTVVCPTCTGADTAN